MMTKFWDTLAENLAGEWQARLLAPPLAFWGGGLLLYGFRHGWDPMISWFNSLDSLEGIALLIASLVLITVSSALMNQFTVPMLRFLEGYWRGPLAGLAANRINRLNKKLNQKEERWSWLAERKNAGEISTAQLSEYARLDAELSNYPVDPAHRMPTRLGNLLRAAEEYSLLHYGLEITITWPRLWLLFPDKTQKEITRSRQSLDLSVQLFTWAFLFLAWAIWNPWAVFAAVFFMLVFYQSIYQNSGAYGELIRSSYDLHRFLLYDALHWPKPTTPNDEESSGIKLTNYLHRGESSKKVKFERPGES